MSCKWVSLSIGILLGNLEGVHLAGFLREKKKYTWVPFLDPENIKILSLVASSNFSKETGFSSVDTRLWDTKGLSIRPRCIRTIGD